MSRLRKVVSNVINGKFTKKAEVEKVTEYLGKRVVSVDPDLVLSLSNLGNVNKYDLDFMVSDDSYITYGLELVNNGANQFSIVAKVYDARIRGVVSYFDESGEEGEVEIEIPLNLENTKIDVYVDNNSIELSTINVNEVGGLELMFMSIN